MHLPKRTRRRRRGKLKSQLDAIALYRIRQNFLWSMDTWGGTRCGSCGLKVPPRFLTNYSGKFKLGNSVGWITAFAPACRYVNNCPGENPNWQFEVKEHER